jgi:hypothetical protein
MRERYIGEEMFIIQRSTVDLETTLTPNNSSVVATVYMF